MVSEKLAGTTMTIINILIVLIMTIITSIRIFL